VTDDNNRRRADHTTMKWIVVASLIALVLILGTIQELAS
jgi:predicted nucleic acid-binding Zn ribbon protein